VQFLGAKTDCWHRHVCPSAWNSRASTWRILMKFDISPNTKIRMQSKHSTPSLSLHDILCESFFTFLCCITYEGLTTHGKCWRNELFPWLMYVSSHSWYITCFPHNMLLCLTPLPVWGWGGRKNELLQLGVRQQFQWKILFTSHSVKLRISP
jgi:hypothetical protein